MRKDYKKTLAAIIEEWKWLMKYVRRYWWSIVIYIIFGVVAIVMGLGSSVASKYLIDIVVNHEKDGILYAAATVIGLAVMQILFQALSSTVTARVGTKVNKEIRSEFYNHLLYTEWEEISRYRTGDLINRLEGDINIISSGVINVLPAVVTRLVQFIGAALIVFYYDKTMAVIAIAGAPVVMITSNYMLKRVRKYNLKTREAGGMIISEYNEVVNNMQMIKSFSLHKIFSEKFRILLEQYRDVRLENEKFSILTTIAMSVIGLIVSYSCYGWGVWRLWQGAISFGTMTLFIQLSGTLTNSFNSMVSLGPSVVSVATAAGRIMELSKLATEKDSFADEAEALLLEAKKGSLEITAENIKFRYSEAPADVIKDVCFTARSGEIIGLVGTSGEGKTTVLRLILGLLHPDDGRITFSSDGKNMLDAGFSTRRLCSYVLQTNNIICGTVAENLRVVKPDATDEELVDVLKAAEAWGFVSKLPDGLNSLIGERNYNLSEGQAQRISIARALLRKSPVLLMDEATSSLDAETEEKVIENIMKRDPKRICILTTHRPSMLRYCSSIYRILEDGKFEEYKKTEE